MNSSWQGVLQRMGNNFVVAAFVPSMGFVVFSFLAFEPVLPNAIMWRLGEEIADIGASVFVVLLFTTILGFTLHTLSIYIYKAFEGYTFVLGRKSALRHSFLQRQKRRAKKILDEKVTIEKEIERLSGKINDQEDIDADRWPLQSKRLKRQRDRVSYLSDRKYMLTALYKSTFPPATHLILPTRFGNILRASEMYASERYHMDAVPLFGRLAHVMPPEGMDKLDQANNECLFLLNSALLSGIFTVLSVFVSMYQGLLFFLATKQQEKLLYFIPINLSNQIYLERIGIYLVVGLCAGLLAWFFYSASLLNVGQYGSMIATSYDLYRFRLLKAFHLPLPVDLIDERQSWRQISEFVVGNEEFGPIGFSYEHENEKN